MRVDGFPEEKEFIFPILEHIEEMLTAFQQEFGPSFDDSGNTRTAIIMVIQHADFFSIYSGIRWLMKG